MIELFSADTPNGKKVSIMLEEIGFKYQVTNISLSAKEQLSAKFKKISPFGKIPVIKDHDNNETVFESGAILIYLAEKSKKFYDEQARLKINQWLMAQMGLIGPMIGQHHQFHHYNPGKSDFGEKRYFEISKRIYKDLDDRLSDSKYLASDKYTIADIATWPWIARHDWHNIGLKNYKYLCNWYETIAIRPAVIRGYKFMNKESEIPTP